MRTFAWIALIAGVLALAGLLGYRWVKRSMQDPNDNAIKPRIEMGGIQIKDMNKETTKADVSVLIDNPAPVGFKADSLSYRFFIAGNEMMQSTYAKAIDLEADDSSMITLPVTIANEKLVETLKNLEGQGVDSVDYTVKTRFHAAIPLLRDKPLEFEVTKRLPLFRIPEVKIIETDLDKLGLNETKVTMKAEITNKNVFPFVFRDTRYRMTLNGEEFTEGVVPSVINVPARGKEVVTIPVELDIKKAAQAGVRLLNKDKANPYSFVFETKVVDSEGNTAFQNSKIRLQNSGDLREIMQVVKEVREEKKQEKKEEKQEKREQKKEERQQKREEKRENKKESN